MPLFWFLQHHHKAGLVEQLESEQIYICYYGLGIIITQLDAFFSGKFYLGKKTRHYQYLDTYTDDDDET